MGFSIVVAHDLNHGIGLNNELPWHCAVDMAYFKSLTIGNKKNAVIMGRNTWLSIPEKYRPLPDRLNIVLSTTQTSFEGAEWAQSLDDALDQAKSAEKTFIIGGAQLYKDAVSHPNCDTLYITKIFNRFNCDTHFPEYSTQFKCIYASNFWVLNQSNCAFFRYIKN